jgi:hypothetical protein
VNAVVAGEFPVNEAHADGLHVLKPDLGVVVDSRSSLQVGAGSPQFAERVCRDTAELVGFLQHKGGEPIVPCSDRRGQTADAAADRHEVDLSVPVDCSGVNHVR